MQTRILLLAFGMALAARGVSDAAPLTAVPAPQVLTLDEAVALAQRNALSVVQAQGQEQTSAAGVRSAYAAFLPSVSLSAGATRQLPSAGARTHVENGQIVTLPTEPWSSNVGLGASVELFAGGRRFFDLRQAHAQESIAEANMVAQRYAATSGVKQQYFNVLAARETEAAGRAQVSQAEQQLRAAVARVRARTATRSDSLRSEIQLRNAQLAVLEARNALQLANASLTRAVGTPYLVTAAQEDSLERISLAVDEANLQQLAENGPAVQQAAAAVEATRSARRSSLADYLPSVNASYSRSGSATGSTLWSNDLSYSGALRLSLSLPLFDQLRREEQLTRAQVAEHNAEASLRDAKLAAFEGFTQSLGAFRSARERIASQSASVQAAEEDLRVQQQRYAVGNATLLDVLTSQTQLDQARRDLIRARYDQRAAKAELESLVGREL